MAASLVDDEFGVPQLPFSLLRRETHDFRDCIGRGATGSVYKGTVFGAAVAVKVLNLAAGAS